MFNSNTMVVFIKSYRYVYLQLHGNLLGSSVVSQSPVLNFRIKATISEIR